jgi:DNA-binding XRE family transcriptional regulator
MRNNLKELRRRCDLTQVELAHQTGVPRSRIQLAEAGTLELRPEELEAIRKALRAGLERTAELLAGDPDLRSIASQRLRQAPEMLDDGEENKAQNKH